MNLNSFCCPVPLCCCSENHQRGHFQCPQNKSTITSIFSVIEVVRQGGLNHAYFLRLSLCRWAEISQRLDSYETLKHKGHAYLWPQHVCIILFFITKCLWTKFCTVLPKKILLWCFHRSACVITMLTSCFVIGLILRIFIASHWHANDPTSLTQN